MTMRVQYEIPNAAAKYILFQRTAYHTYTNGFLFRTLRRFMPGFSYDRMVQLEAKLNAKKIGAMYLADMESEYSTIRDFLPVECSRILDIGCGIAGIDIYLNQHYLDKSVVFFLLDKSQLEESVYYMYQEKGAFYNSLGLAKEALVKNGIETENVHLIEATENNEIVIDKSVDLVLSLISWGFHYPVGIYLDKVFNLLNEGGIVILDIRKDTDGLDLLAEKFGGYKKVIETSKYYRVCATKNQTHELGQ